MLSSKRKRHISMLDDAIFRICPAERLTRMSALFLRTLRDEAGLTQRALGQRLGKPQSWVYNCETGNRRVDLGEFCEWCLACSVDPITGLRRFLRGE